MGRPCPAFLIRTPERRLLRPTLRDEFPQRAIDGLVPGSAPESRRCRRQLGLHAPLQGQFYIGGDIAPARATCRTSPR